MSSAAGLRIALFTGNYNYLREGANNALNRLVGHILERGGDVRVYSPTSPSPAFAPVGTLISVPSFPLPVRSEFRVATGLNRRLVRDIRGFRPNIVHVATPDLLGMAAQRLARREGLPVVASLHTKFETYLKFYGLGFLSDWAWRKQKSYYEKAQLVLAPSEAMVEHLSAMGVDEAQIRIWSRGIDTELFNPSLRGEVWRSSHGYSPSDVVICFFGRLVREKGTEIFARTIAELRRKGHRVRPLVIGDGPARSEFLGSLGDHVEVGHLDGPALGRALASADILLNPSETETFGNVNREAMAAGLVVVGADIASARAVIDNGRTGLLRAPEPLELARALEQLIASPDDRQRLSRRAQAGAASANWTDVNDAAVRAYRELAPSTS